MPLPVKSLLFVPALVMLVGCVGSNRTESAPPVQRSVGGPMVSDTPVRIGDAYSIGGNRYTPVDQQDYDEVGYASWYGAELEGRPTANGEAFRAAGVSAAHRTLPMPSYVEVTRLDTGRTIVVRINDRGPGVATRLIDLSSGAAEELGISGMGAVAVRVRRTFPEDSERAALRSGLAVPPRLDTSESLLEILRQRADRLPRPAGQVAPTAVRSRVPAASLATPANSATSTSSAAPSGAGGALVVQIAAFSSRARADVLARRIGATVVSAGSLFRVRYGPFATETEAQAAVARARAQGQPGAVIQRLP